MACPQKFQFASDMGFIRRDVVHSSIDARIVRKSMDDECACTEFTQKLQICGNVSRSCQKGITQTLVDPETQTQFEFPQGTTITKVTIVDRTCGNLSCELSFMLGYISDCIQDDTLLALTAQRIAPVDAQITGTLLNVYHKLVIDQTLTSDALAAQRAIYDQERAERGECMEEIDFAIVRGNNYVAEPLSQMPVITVTSGDLCVGDLDFFLLLYPTLCRNYLSTSCYLHAM